MEKDWSLISSFVLFFSAVIISIPPASSLSFNLSSFDQSENLVLNQSDATLNGSEINLTEYPMQYATGRVEYGEPLFLWDAGTGVLTDFTTRFSFVIDSFNSSEYADGLAFFLSPFNSSKPPYSRGGFLGLFSNSSLTNYTAVEVAVEFDTFSNDWDPKGVHLGIDVDSIVSKVTAPWNADAGVRAGREATAWVSYNSTTHNLSVLVGYASDPTSTTGIFLIVDLRDVLPEMVGIGFSSTTGNLTATHTILSWYFNSTLQLPQDDRRSKKAEVVGITAGAAAGAVALAVVIACGLIWWWRWRKPGIDDSLSVWFAREASGPREFNYEVLASATSNFSPEVKLGGGGFGSVYRGQLNDRHVAIKKVAREGEQGITEYISEVTIISRLRHRNLVELVGWCHRREREEYLLVYEFMPQGSLDKHLYSAGECMPWPQRRDVVLGLAAALHYLHHECKPSVVHRDVKPSNVMLDSEYNAKLGDFGLARLLDGDCEGDQRQASTLAGTRPYMAPEYCHDGKFSTKTDVYSFGIVALDIACGRKPREVEMQLVEWVWELYGRGEILDAADRRLTGEFDGCEMERLMVVGLWCAHPDCKQRPTIQEAIRVLRSEKPLPELPPTRPRQVYRHPSEEVFSSAVSNLVTASRSSRIKDNYSI